MIESDCQFMTEGGSILLFYKTGTHDSFCFVLKAVDWSYRRETSMEFHRYYWTYGLLSQRSVLHGHTAWGSSLGSTQNSLGNSQYSLGTTSCNHTGGLPLQGRTTPLVLILTPRWIIQSTTYNLSTI